MDDFQLIKIGVLAGGAYYLWNYTKIGEILSKAEHTIEEVIDL